MKSQHRRGSGRFEGASDLRPLADGIAEGVRTKCSDAHDVVPVDKGIEVHVGAGPVNLVPDGDVIRHAGARVEDLLQGRERDGSVAAGPAAASVDGA